MNMKPTIATSPESDKDRIVIYHASCADGFTAAWCAWLKYGDDAEYLPAQYGDEPPDVTGKDVLIVDFSYPRAVLLDMELQKPRSLRILDHHKTAQEALRGLSFAKFDMNRSGAGLAWDELHGLPRPVLVDYVEDRDLWRWKLSASREVSAWLGSFDFDFDTWNDLHDQLSIPGNFQGIVQSGSAILRSADRHAAHMCKQAGRAVVGGYFVPFINTTSLTSEIVGKLAEEATFACGWFQRSDGKFVYSLRSRDGFDVSVIAKQYGGGGHPGAAGFTLDRLIPVETT